MIYDIYFTYQDKIHNFFKIKSPFTPFFFLFDKKSRHDINVQKAQQKCHYKTKQSGKGYLVLDEKVKKTPCKTKL